MSIRSIQTIFDGIKFRSRTEARWAVAMNHADMRFQYEPEGYELLSGWYIPDFYLKAEKVYLEIKGDELSWEDYCKAEQLCGQTLKKVLVAVGNPDHEQMMMEIDPYRPVEPRVFKPVSEYFPRRAIDAAMKHRFDWWTTAQAKKFGYN